MQYDPGKPERSTLSLKESTFASNEIASIVVYTADATIDSIHVEGTRATADGQYGDGVVAMVDSKIALTRSRIGASPRAGISTFGSHVTVGATTLECNAIDLDGEAYPDESSPGAFETQPLDACGCDADKHACQVLSSALAPPKLSKL